MNGRAGRLWPWSLFAAMLAAAGLPIYLHAPKFYVDQHGLTLAQMGLILLVLRLVDVVQDPALGLLAGATRQRRARIVAGAATLMALAMLALFALPPQFSPALWFSLSLLVLFSAWSFLSITFYAEGVSHAERMGPAGHVRLAGWRETGSLLGVCLAAIAPVALAGLSPWPFGLFAAGFVLLTLAAILAMRSQWSATPAPKAAFGPALKDPMTRHFLLLAVLNGAPVAVTSTLFLFFVESTLQSPGWEGPFLLLFFLSAALSAPLWVRLAGRKGPRRALFQGMGLSLLSFGFALGLGPGDLWAFGLICFASGAGLGADLTLLPALFARHLSQQGQNEATGFGLWSFAGKLPLALAAGALLPLLQLAGFRSGGDQALWALNLAYAGLPCLLKLGAMALLWRMRLDKDEPRS